MYLGIDGCKHGWICAQLNKDAISFKLIEHINEVKNLNSELIFIDIPIGLGDQFNTEQSILNLENYYQKKKKQCFYPPIREALEAPTYQLGNQIINLFRKREYPYKLGISVIK